MRKLNRLLLCLGLALVIHACGDDDEDSAGCNGNANSTQEDVLGADLPSGYVVTGDETIESSTIYDVLWDGAPGCTYEIRNQNGETIAQGAQPDLGDISQGGDPISVAFTQVGGGDLGAQGTSEGSAIDLDGSGGVVLRNSNADANDKTQVFGYGVSKVDLVFAENGGQLWIYNPQSVGDVTGNKIYKEQDVSDRVQLYQLADSTDLSSAANVTEQLGSENLKQRVEVNPIADGAQKIAVTSSEGNLYVVTIDSITSGGEVDETLISITSYAGTN